MCAPPKVNINFALLRSRSLVLSKGMNSLWMLDWVQKKLRHWQENEKTTDHCLATYFLGSKVSKLNLKQRRKRFMVAERPSMNPGRETIRVNFQGLMEPCSIPLFIKAVAYRKGVARIIKFLLQKMRIFQYLQFSLSFYLVCYKNCSGISIVRYREFFNLLFFG